MRRIVLLVVIALVGAGFAGRLVGASAIKVNGTVLSSSQLRRQLTVLHDATALQCYFSANLGVSAAPGASTLNAKFVAQWTNFELSELAVVDHVRTVDHFSGDAAEAATGKSRLGVDLQAAVTAAGDSCPETAAKALNAAPKWFVTQQSVLYDASLVFINNVKGAIKLNAASLAYYFKSNTANYRTICATYVAIQDVQSTITTFLAGVKKNKPATQLAKQFNGSTNLYCYKPGYTGYVAIREYTEGQTLDRFPQEPQTEQDQDGTYYFYFVAPTSYSENTYATAAPAVLADARNYNDSLAAVAEKHLLASSHIAVAFPFGTWDAKTQQVVGVTAPLPADVLNNGQGLIP